jgi:hypothetical protein
MYDIAIGKAGRKEKRKEYAMKNDKVNESVCLVSSQPNLYYITTITPRM